MKIDIDWVLNFYRQKWRTSLEVEPYRDLFDQSINIDDYVTFIEDQYKQQCVGRIIGIGFCIDEGMGYLAFIKSLEPKGSDREIWIEEIHNPDVFVVKVPTEIVPESIRIRLQ